MYHDVFPNELSLWTRRGAILLDVREPEEWAQGHIPGSLNVPLGELLEHLGELRDPIVTVCASGSRAALAAEVLGYEGFAEVGRLLGGIQGYVRHGHPLARRERPTEAACS
ncbi:rhodanese-like domain-containing protein [Calidithermus roseus]|uniref:Thiosulfate sulfurtransferase PspE n=1 Tax=Calidithermus roseus TaxID=1644118 RepID=A0A399F0C2_9DEIN|nr:rhodanese-like domain-containing protein [Calidithermus roseus]RIH89420.1 Thiosulfate sulfurtransferase PspE [Calidithermus roseus]